MVLLYVLVIVYILAVNAYAIVLLLSLRGEGAERGTGDGKLLLAALLGGAIGLYVTIFITRFKIKNMLLMISLPPIAVLNVWLAVIAFRSGMTIFIV